MKNIYSKLNLNSNYLLLILLVFIGNLYVVNAQIKVPFTQRTSIYTPGKTIYNVKGDFTMIGNTNLTLVNYGDETSNNNNMQYVDIDGDSNTWNSSSSNLTFSTENGANPACSNIVYAGLYWTGRASDGSSSPNIFTVEKQIPGGTQTINQNYTVGHNQAIANTSYTMTITRDNPTNTNRSPIYTFTSGSTTYVFRFSNNTGANRVTLSVNGGTAVNVPVSYTTSGSTGTATLTTPYVIANGTVNLRINSLVRDTATNLTTTNTETTSFANVNVAGTIIGTTTISKTFDKRKVSIKGPNSSSYTLLTADDDDIYYPVNGDGFMYSGYVEVTDYVRTNGIGAYTVADVALIEGNGGGTGYYGGWGLVVVYENDKMKWRDVTVFDGHSYVAGSVTADFEIPVSGFNTAQSGAINMKLGMMAGEGDRGISGDYFQIRNYLDTSWVTLNHGGNSTNNFFNSSIFTGGNTRNPNILNNTGLDISMFNIPNTGNSVITNNQTSTRFRYGTTQDTYVIFNLTMSVDAYIPETEGLLSIISIGGVPFNPGDLSSAQPGQEVEFGIDIKNLGTEAVNDYRLVIPIPFTSTYVPGSLNTSIFFSPDPTPNNLYYDANLGATGSLVWDFGTLPLPADPQTLLASLRFKLRATDNCAILSNPDCVNSIIVLGYTSGTGNITGTPFRNRGLILGYDNSNGSCQGQPIPQPLGVGINAGAFVAQNCQDVPLIRNFSYCNVTEPIPASQLAAQFPPGTKFYATYPVTTPEITSFPVTPGISTTYYAVIPNSNGCHFEFTMSFCGEIIAINDIINSVECITNGLIGNALENDSVNGVQASSSNVTFTIDSGSNPNITFDAQGNISVTTGIAAGQYVFGYTICEIMNPTNCISATITINIVDTTDPTIVALPTESTINCPATPDFAQAIANDSCGTATLTFVDVRTDGDCAGSYSITRTWTATDASGNTSTASQTINVQDVSAPVIADLPIESTINCPAVPQFTQATATDECGSEFTLSFSDVTTNGACAGSYSITRTWTATDTCGNSSTATQTINVQDITAPVIADLPSETTISCLPSIVTRFSLNFVEATATDECNSEFTLTFNDVRTDGDCAGSYSVTRTWTATDTCGNSSTASQTINIEDVVAPIINALPAESTIECPAVPEFAQAIASDECGSEFSLSFNDITTSGSCAGSYSITRTWTATDTCGNSSTATQTINVEDNTIPVLVNQGADTTISCPSTPTFSAPTVSDTCDSAPVISFTDTTIAGACLGTSIVTRTWIATDACGNVSNPVSQTITVQDITAPVTPEAPAALTLACASEVPAAVSLTATDNCAGEITASGVDTIAAGQCPNSFVITRTWTFTDACNNSSAVSQIITVNDTIAPTFVEALPTDSTVQCDAVPTAATLTATDNCGTAAVTFAESIAQGACPGAYTITRTWTATDACNNVTTHVQTITVQNTTAPTFVEALPTDSTVQCDAVPTAATLTATDNCGTAAVTFAESITQGSCPGAYTITRTWTATDACNNVTAHVQTITVQDTTAPTFVEALPTDSTVQCDAVPTAATLTATDNCGTAAVTFAESITQGACPGAYTITRTWTATDACNNVTAHVQTITVQDTTAPTFVEALPTDSTVQCDAVPTAATLTATDNCGTAAVTFAESITQGACPGAYTITRTWTATDACNNVTAHVQTITVQDTTAPVITTQASSIVVECDGSGNQGAVQEWLASNGGAVATDNCSDVTWSNDFDALSNDCSAAITVIFTATDACGNTASSSATFTVQDITAPVTPEAPAALTLACASEVPAAVSLTATDNCAGEITASGVDTIAAGQCPNSFVITRTWTFTDTCNNSSAVSQIITVNDTIAPTFVEALPTDSTVQCDAVPTAGTLTATDNCGTAAVTFAESIAQGACPGAYTITRTWTATDACNNVTAHVQTITVQDTTAPTFVEALPTDSTVQCDAVPTAATLTATDNCGTAAVTFAESITQGACPGAYTITRTWTATDACNNVTAHVQTITVQDTTAPTFVEALPTDSTVQCDAVPTAATLTATDNCGTAAVTFAESIAQGACPGAYTITRTWTATDACNNVTAHVQTITVQDTTAPTFVEALPTDSTVQCDAVPTAATLTATDNCGTAAVTFAESITQGACPGAYTITRTWTATDACNNVTAHVQTITVQDTTAPTFVEALPTDSTVQCDAVPTAATLTATDNCGTAAVTFAESIAQGACPGAYTITRTWTATDACNNVTAHVQTITVQDTTAPTFVEALPTDSTVQCDAVPTAATLTATDNCGTAAVTFAESITQGACPGAYTITRTWTATDACNNVTAHVQTITVQDTTAPTFVEALPTDSTVQCDAVPTAATLTATDNCGTAAVTFAESIAQGACPGAYTITRTWTATDACNNVTAHVQTITVQDTTAPTFVEALPTDSTVQCDAVPTAATLTATDNCGTAAVTFAESITQGACPGAYTITRTWTATDACNNVTAHVQTITVQDTTAPTFVEALPTDSTVQCDAVPTAATLTATDNCGTAAVTFAESITQGACPGAYTITRTWTATDACNNVTAHVQTITVQDTTAPTFVEALPTDSTVQCDAVPTAATLTATDNCGTAAVTFAESITQGACPGAYTITRTWTATDACNNVTAHVQTITVQDTTAPTFVEALPTDSTVQCDAVPTAATLTATDNCGTAAVTFAESITQGACPGAYTITRTWTATDACNNVTAHVQTITVQDTTAPVITTQASSIVVECDGSGNQGAVQEWLASNGGAVATDNCSDVTWSNDFDALSNDCSAAITVIFTATDACGNTASSSATFTVQDITAPVTPEAPAALTLACASEVPAAVSLTATDNCAGEITASGVDTIAAGQCPNSFVITRTWTFTDACNNSSAVSQIITVNDTIAPTFVEALPTDSTVQCDAVPTAGTLTATDNCGTAAVTFAESIAQGACPGAYTITRTWTATDACNNVTAHVQTITVQDTTAPTFVEALPTDSTVQCDAVPTAATLTATDNCGTAAVTFAESITQGACPGAYTITRTWTATDACNNVTAHVQTITVQDTTAPTFVEALPTDSTVQCDAVPTAATLTATDNCGTAAVTFAESIAQGACPGAYTITRTWTATDACNNVTAHVQTITVQDTTAPTFVEALPTDSTVQCDAVTTAATLTATDNCGTAAVTFAESIAQGACPGAYTITRTWTATDACNNVTAHVQTITVQDTTAPTFVEALPTDSTVQCDAVPTAATLTATDNCGTAAVTFAESITQGACPGAYTITRTWTATDACNNVTAHVQTITVQDTTAPVITTQASSIVVECDGSGNQGAVQEWLASNGGAVATDNCSDVTWSNDFDALSNDCSAAITVIFTATDTCGNTASSSATFTVQDITAPVTPEAPAALTLACASEVPAAVSLTATDNCAGEITASGVDTIAAGQCPNSFVITRTWTFTDACNNSSAVSQIITVNDTIAPTFVEALPTDSTVQCDAVPTAATLTATDNCGTAAVTFAESIAQGACPGAYTITRTWTATDACNNVTAHVQTITVQDTTAPTFVEALPTDSTVQCDAVPTAATLTATDNCGTAAVTFAESIAQGACPGAYTITRTWTATDACNNVTAHVQTITVQDTTAPTFVEALPTDSTVQCDAVPTAATLTATDNCGTAAVTFAESIAQGACPGAYTITRTWTATDACNNVTAHVQTITVQDTTAPTFVEALPTDSTVQCDAVPTAATLTATDNCGTAAVTFAESIAQGACPGAYTITRTWTATDACNNVTAHVQTITVQDTTAPTFVETLPQDTSAECSNIPVAATLTATDSCGDATVTFTEAIVQGECTGDFVITRTWTATDLCGNSVSHEQIIIVQDTTGPISSAYDENISVTCDSIPASPDLTFTDACSTVGGVTFSEEIVNESATSYTIVRTWEVSDSCGNLSTFTQTINVTIQDSFTPISSVSCIGDSTPIDLNTLLPTGTTGGTWIDVNNTGALNNNIFTPTLVTAIGNYIFRYEITEGSCPRVYEVTMNVNDDCITFPCDAINIYNAMSPNGDGLNEFFNIENIENTECYSSNSVEIYNRWGVLVYDVQNYDNSSKAFRGVSEGRATVNKSAELPTGTYFYIIQYTTFDGDVVNKSGYLYLTR